MTDLLLGGLDGALLDYLAVPARLVTVLDGASHVLLDFEDEDNAIRDAALTAGASGWVTWDERRFVLAGLRSTPSRVRLVFEDHVVATLRRQRDPLMVPAGSTTRPELVARLATEAAVGFEVDPDTAVIPTVVRRGDSWSTLAGLGWARFSDGDKVVVGSSDWLLDRQPPIETDADTDLVREVHLSLWTNKTHSTATLLVEEEWPGWPGDPVTLLDLDTLDDAPWLVSSRTFDQDAETATVVLTRAPWMPEGEPTWPA